MVSGVIEVGGEHPKAAALYSKLREVFVDVMEHLFSAYKIDPTLRGPFGSCKIVLKESAKSIHEKIFDVLVKERWLLMQ